MVEVYKEKDHLERKFSVMRELAVRLHYHLQEKK